MPGRERIRDADRLYRPIDATFVVADVLAVYRPIDAADVAADVPSVTTYYTRPMWSTCTGP